MVLSRNRTPLTSLPSYAFPNPSVVSNSGSSDHIYGQLNRDLQGSGSLGGGEATHDSPVWLSDHLHEPGVRHCVVSFVLVAVETSDNASSITKRRT